MTGLNQNDIVLVSFLIPCAPLTIYFIDLVQYLSSCLPSCFKSLFRSQNTYSRPVLNTLRQKEYDESPRLWRVQRRIEEGTVEDSPWAIYGRWVTFFFSFLHALTWLIDIPSGSSNAQLTYRPSHASRHVWCNSFLTPLLGGSNNLFVP